MILIMMPMHADNDDNANDGTQQPKTARAPMMMMSRMVAIMLVSIMMMLAMIMMIIGGPLRSLEVLGGPSEVWGP